MPAKHGTPLDLLALPSFSNYSIGLVSARGSNPDIVKAFESASLGESRGLVAITFAESSKLANHGKKYPWARVVLTQLWLILSLTASFIDVFLHLLA